MANKIGPNIYLTLSQDEYGAVVEALKHRWADLLLLERPYNAVFVSELLKSLGEPVE